MVVLVYASSETGESRIIIVYGVNLNGENKTGLTRRN